MIYTAHLYSHFHLQAKRSLRRGKMRDENYLSRSFKFDEKFPSLEK